MNRITPEKDTPFTSYDRTIQRIKKVLFSLYNAKFFYDNLYSQSHKYLLTLPDELKIIDFTIRVATLA